MRQLLNAFLRTLPLAPIQGNGAMRVIPMLSAAAGGAHYLTLKSALAKGTLVITEISEGGSVPNLKARNDGEEAVLILDGEELKGAKQNRVLNTSVLVAPHSEVIMPVSCTEAGRWSYRSDRFHESGNVLSSEMRAAKSGQVNESLKSHGAFDSNQSELWDKISDMQARHEHRSGTSAMEDVYVHERPNLDAFAQAFPWVEGQCGVMVFLGSHFAGLDMLSLPSAWNEVHSKIIRSYAIDAIRMHQAEQQPLLPEDWLWEQLEKCVVTPRKSVALGEDLRIEGERIVGASLLWEATLVHTAIYPARGHGAAHDPYHSPRHRAYR